MKLGRMLLAGAGLVAAAGTVAGVLTFGSRAPSFEGAALAASTARVTHGQVLFDDGGRGVVRPAGYGMGGMANEVLTGMKWTSWSDTAYGSGAVKLLNCTPTCAQGHYSAYPILAVLWRAKPWPGHPGEQYFTRVTWIYTGKRPAHSPAAYTTSLP